MTGLQLYEKIKRTRGIPKWGSYNRMKYGVAAAYYDLYHQNNPYYPEAQNKKEYCDMMVAQMSVNGLECMRRMSQCTMQETPFDTLREKARILYLKICRLQDKYHSDYFLKSVSTL